MFTKYFTRLLICLFLSSGFLIAEDQDSEALSQQEMQQLSEAFGHFIGKSLNIPGIDFDMDRVIQGIRDHRDGKNSPLSEQEYEQLMARLQAATYRKISESNLYEANRYLEKNASESGVVIVEPGKLHYKITEEGSGEVVKENGAPKIQYTGTYIDGTVFGSSEESGGPITIPLDQTIPGFAKGIVGMKEGEKRRIFVHPDLGYGSNGPLPPNMLLILDVKVIEADSTEEGN